MSGLAGDSREKLSYSGVVSLLANSQKSGRGAPAYSRFVNRPLGRRFAAVAYLAGLTPNGVTFISAVFTFTGVAILLFIGPSLPLGIGVAALLVIGYGLDAADGQLARLTGGGSLSGEWLDHMVDCVKASSLHLAVAVNAFRFWDVSNVWLLVPLGLSVLDNTEFFGQILGEQLKRSKQSPTATGSPSPIMSLFKIPMDYGVLALSFVLFGANQVFAWLYTFLLVARFAYLVLALPRWYGQMRDLDLGAER